MAVPCGEVADGGLLLVDRSCRQGSDPTDPVHSCGVRNHLAGSDGRLRGQDQGGGQPQGGGRPQSTFDAGALKLVNHTGEPLEVWIQYKSGGEWIPGPPDAPKRSYETINLALGEETYLNDGLQERPGSNGVSSLSGLSPRATASGRTTGSSRL